MDVTIPEPFRSALERGELHRVVDLEATSHAGLFGRGLARARLGRTQDARHDFETTLGDLELEVLSRLELAFLDVQTGVGLDEAARLAVDIVGREGVPTGSRARALHLKGWTLGKLRKTGSAAESLLQAADLYALLGDRRSEAETYDTLGSLYAAQGQLENAVSYYALSLAEKAVVGDRAGLAITMGNLGRLHLRAGRFREAERCFELDLRIAEEIGDDRGRARMHNDLGRARLGEGDLEGAIEHLRSGLELAEAHGYEALKFFGHKDLALVHIELFRRNRSSDLSDKADKHLREAERCLQRIPDPTLDHVLRVVRAERLLVEGDADGLELLEEATRSLSELDLPDLEIPTLVTLARELATRGYTRSAEHHLDRALARARRDGYARYLPVVREALKDLELLPNAVEERGRSLEVSPRPEDTDGYTHLRTLGKGGFGEVYRALDPRSNRLVAIKRLRLQELHEPKTRQRLLDSLRVEVEAASRIHHPGVGKVLRIGIDAEDRPYLVTELIDGVSLREVIRRRIPPSEQDVLAFSRDAADALEALHSHEIIHRDVKPENVLLRESSGQPVLIDFGIAHVPSNRSACDSGFIVGSLSYMSPEQASGSRVEGRTDVYSLGVVLYEWLTGSLPVVVQARDLNGFFRELREKRPNPLRDLRPDLSGTLTSLVHSMLEKRPADRPFAREVCERCAAALVSVGPASPSPSASAYWKRTQTVALPETRTVPGTPTPRARDGKDEVSDEPR